MTGTQVATEKQQDIYLPVMADVLEAEPMTKLEMYFKFKMASGEELGHMPGQFVEVSVPGIGEAPISISSSPTQKGSFEMVVRRVGNVSSAMHRLQAGDRVGIRGPFGTTFPVDGALKGKNLLFICGGIGLVPVRSAINYVLDNRADYGDVTILFGTKTPADRLFTDEMDRWGGAEKTTFMETVDRGDDDWQGNVGVITTLIPKVDIDPESTVAIVCGPPIMYKFVILELDKTGLRHDNVYLSLERHMKCGVGKCGHCQINGLYACQEGAVVRYSDISNVQEAI